MSSYAQAVDLVIRFPLNFDIWAPPRQRRPGRYMTILDPLSELPTPPTSLPAPLSTPVLSDAPHFVEINLADDDTPTQSQVRVFLSRVSGFLRRVFRVKMDA
ncbi:uncharacterized protein LOC125380034 isoform X2 [Haliotis rufescens]|uniref:uncharacterized protein LOC125380034 isoform X1 n=1 Tax=Haliotis rufescens TaxID=6454 RepID=UPI00201EF106|nr:uncharacterized protein LOC125380034 isoform X1 [Haliotis rufescens]XP_048252012.1 uncharacterized protein LOC125380034 isoform X2 [Haliotis rufescens]